jgi:hypothetical protein
VGTEGLIFLVYLALCAIIYGGLVLILPLATVLYLLAPYLGDTNSGSFAYVWKSFWSLVWQEGDIS